MRRRILASASLGLGVALGACEPNGSTELVEEVQASELPGSSASNAAKAYRLLWAELEQEMGQQGFNLAESLEVNSAPHAHLFDQIEAISELEPCDWGNQRWFGVILPNVSVVRGLSYIIEHRIDQSIKIKDAAGAAQAIVAQIRLANHLANGWTMIEKIVAETVLARALDRIDRIEQVDLVPPTSAKLLAEALSLLDSGDPLKTKEALEASRDTFVAACESGYFASGEVAKMYRLRPRPSLRQVRRAAGPYRDAMNHLISEWLTTNFAGAHQIAEDEASRSRVAAHLFVDFRKTNQTMMASRDRIAAMRAQLGAIGAPEESSP